MLDFLGVTENWSAIENIPWTQRWMFSDDATREPVSLDGVAFTGRVYIERESEPVELDIQKSAAAQETNVLIVSCIGLPEGRHAYEIYSVSESGNQNRLISGYIGVIKSIGKLVDDAKTYASRTLTIRLPTHVTRQIRLEWNSCTIASVSAEHALNAAKQTHTDAETATKAATTATTAAGAATERAREAEGYAASADASKVAAGSSAESAAASASAAAKDAKTASDARAAVEGLAAAWPQTVRNGEQAIGAAQDAAVAVIRTKQSDAVLAVGRASQTAQQSVAGAQSAAVQAVETAQTTAETSVGELVQQAAEASSDAEKAAERAGTSATAAQKALAAMPVDANGNMTLAGNLAAQGATFARTVNANGGVNIPVAPVTAGNAVNLGSLPMSIFMPGHALTLLKSLWECYGSVEDTASGIHIKDVVAGAFGGVCTRVMQWSDYASTATILTVITLTGGNGANVLIDAAYNPNAGVSITLVTSPGTAFLPNAVQLSLFETRQGTTVTGRLVGVDGAVKTFSVPSQMDSHSCVYRIFLLETGSAIKAYLGKFQSGMFDGEADVLERPVYLGEMPVPNNPWCFCFLGIAGIQGGEGNSFSSRIPTISDVRRFYGKWLINLFR